MSNSLLPEWEEQIAVLIAWPYPEGDWAANFSQVDQCYWQILKVMTEHIDVWVLLKPTKNADNFISAAIEYGVSQDKFDLINSIDYDDTWVRDYGPLSVKGTWVSPTFNGWGGKFFGEKDNAVAQQLAELKTTSIKKLDWVAEGGALEINDDGVLLANMDCVVDSHRNDGMNKSDIEARLSNDLGVKGFAWLANICLSGDDTDGHIDTMARFASNDKIVYSGRNAKHTDALVLESLHTQLCALAKHYSWRLFELPSPQLKSEIDGRMLPATYANFLICNDVVFVPVYGLAEDELALGVLREAFAGKEIISLNCEALVEQHGSLHCSTMQIAK